MAKIKRAFLLSKEALDVLEEAKWVLRKPKNRIVEELIVLYLRVILTEIKKKYGMIPPPSKELEERAEKGLKAMRKFYKQLETKEEE